MDPCDDILLHSYARAKAKRKARGTTAISTKVKKESNFLLAGDRGAQEVLHMVLFKFHSLE